MKCILKRIFADIKPLVLVIVGFTAYYLFIHALFDAFCPLLIAIGIPCAGCGLTRAGLYLLQGNVARAFNINPSIFLIVIFLIYCGYFRYIKGEKIKGIAMAFPMLILCMLVVYGYKMYLYYPDKAPYVFHRKNILSTFVPWYNDWMMRLGNSIRSWRG